MPARRVRWRPSDGGSVSREIVNGRGWSDSRAENWSEKKREYPAFTRCGLLSSAVGDGRGAGKVSLRFGLATAWRCGRIIRVEEE